MSANKMGDITIYRNVHKKSKDESPDYRGKGEIINEENDVIKLEFSLWINSELREVPIHLSGQITEGEYK